jgi:glycosyltransferase involved in cell wall biosynthesis
MYGADIATVRKRYALGPVKGALDWLAMHTCDRVTFVSRGAALDVLGPVRGPEAQVVHNGLPSALPPGNYPRPADLIYVGGPGHGKRARLLPFILKHVAEILPRVRLRLVGIDPSQNADLVSDFQKLGLLERVVFEGIIPAADIRPIYERVAVLVVPSAYEGLPMVILEALRAGVPSVACDVGGNAEAIVDGHNGFLVEPDNPRLLADKVAEILASDELRGRMSRAAITVFKERFTVDRQIDDYLAIYEELLDRGRVGH